MARKKRTKLTPLDIERETTCEREWYDYIYPKIMGQRELIGAIGRHLSWLGIDRSDPSTYCRFHLENEAPFTCIIDGPSGTGKTRVVEYLAEFLFGKTSSMLRVDCAVYSEKHQASEFTGVSKGFEGAGTENRLSQQKIDQDAYVTMVTDYAAKNLNKRDKKFFDKRFPLLLRLKKEYHLWSRTDKQPANTYYGSLKITGREITRIENKLRTMGCPECTPDDIARSYVCIILLDEFGIAHKNFSRLFYRVADDGIFSDVTGEETRLHSAFIFMTTNHSADEILKKLNVLGGKGVQMGFILPKPEELLSDLQKISRKGLVNYYGAPFINRLSKVITSHPHTKETARGVLELAIAELPVFLKGFSLDILIKNDVKDYFVDALMKNLERGARLINRQFQDEIVFYLRRLIATDQLNEGDSVVISLDVSDDKKKKLLFRKRS